GAPSLAITTTTLPPATVGQPYNFTLLASAGRPPYRWGVNGLPGGLVFDRSTGTITGTAINAGTFQVSVQVEDSGQTVSTRTLTLTVSPPALAITTVAPLFNGTVGVAYVQRFTAAGGTPPYRWSVISGSIGDLTLDPDSGTLQGTPQAAGTSSFTIQVTDNL